MFFKYNYTIEINKHSFNISYKKSTKLVTLLNALLSILLIDYKITRIIIKSAISMIKSTIHISLSSIQSEIMSE